jgi:anti-sigma B factor antagonist
MQDNEPDGIPRAKGGAASHDGDAEDMGSLPFSVHTSRRKKESFVELSGELDLSSAPLLREALVTTFTEDRPGRLVLDLSNLIYLDSTGLSVFVTTHKRAAADGIEFCLANPNGSVRRLLQITALDQVFVIVDEDGSVLPPLPPRDPSPGGSAAVSDEASPSS